MKDIAIYGAGGYGREIACLLRRINLETEPSWNLIGFFDDGEEKGSSNEYGEVLGDINTLNDWKSPLSIVFAIGSPKTVKKLYENIANPLIDFPNIMAPDTLMLDSSSLRLGKGNVFCSRCLVSCNVSIGDFNTFNNSVSIGHDACIGDFNSVMPSVKISGGVRIGNRNFIGVNSVVLQYKSVGNDVVLGASAVLMRNAADGKTYVGNPAKKIEY